MDARPQRTALLVIDPQNDFLSEGGAFSKRHADPAQLARTIAWLVSAARQQGRGVVWVTSVYGETGQPSDGHRGQTHLGAPCCVRGSWGAGVVPALRGLFDAGVGRPRELHVEKRWYSPFRETGLHDWLQAAGITRLLLCGVATNICVFTTARDALGLGYAVDVLADATTAGTQGKHLAALRDIQALGGRQSTLGAVLAEAGTRVVLEGLGAGDTSLWCGALRDCLGDDGSAYDALEQEVFWSPMFHRGGEVPRRVALQGTRGPDGSEPLYRHPVDGAPPLAGWTPLVDRIRRAVEAHVGHPLNHCLLQLYRHGRDWIGEHTDKTLDLARPSSIVNVSLGRTRTMVLRPKRTAAGTQKLPLPHGSFLVMGLETNREFSHSIRQEGESDEDGPRISLTFRHIGTLYDAGVGAVWGVGAPTSSRAEAEARARARAALPASEREQRERAEAGQLIQLFRQENADPDFDPASYRPGFDTIDLRTLREAP